MFEVDGTYANRRGEYKVLSIDGPAMSIRYTDGTEAEVKIAIQQRIWANIQAEQELRDKRNIKRAKKKKTASVNHYLKVINVSPGEELAFPGWEERVVLAPTEETASKISKGDRLIYFSPEAMAFFAVATVTGDAFEDNPKKYTFTIPQDKAAFFQIDIDADTGTLEKGITLDSVELESNFSAEAQEPEAYIPISEDDFELLAEFLAEISEEDEEEDDDEDEEYEEDDE